MTYKEFERRMIARYAITHPKEPVTHRHLRLLREFYDHDGERRWEEAHPYAKPTWTEGGKSERAYHKWYEQEYGVVKPPYTGGTQLTAENTTAVVRKAMKQCGAWRKPPELRNRYPTTPRPDRTPAKYHDYE